MSSVAMARGRDERVAQTEQVHVGRQLDVLGAPGQERQVRERVEHRGAGRHRRVLLTRERRAAHLDGKHEVLGEPHRFVAEALGSSTTGTRRPD